HCARKAGCTREALRRAPWCGFDDDHNYMPGQSWLLALLDGARPALRVNNWLVLQQAARAGAGLAVLPCYLGDGDPALRRLGPLLSGAPAAQGLLLHPHLRALPRVRAVMDAVIRLFQEERATIEGRSATRSSSSLSSPSPLMGEGRGGRGGGGATDKVSEL